jgi:putative Holliday junction resolvase
MRILGIDFGDRSLGLAVSDPLFLTAQGLGRYRTQNKEKDKKYFLELVSQYEIGEIVIGLPLRMDGSSGTRVEKTKKFARWLEKILSLPVTFWDERLTTQQALKIISEQKTDFRKKKTLKDQISASLILSSYLESKKAQDDDTQSH